MNRQISFGVHEYTIISWGSTKGPIIDAQSMLRKEGTDVGFIQIKLTSSISRRIPVKSLLKNAKVLIDIEANHSGQLGKIFQQNTFQEKLIIMF